MRTRIAKSIKWAAGIALVLGLAGLLQAEPFAKDEKSPPGREARKTTPDAPRKKGDASKKAGTPKKAPGQTVTLLGVHATPLSPAVRAQLDLPPGAGVGIGSIMPGSPAEKAGLVEHDVITRIDDQVILLAEQLQMLVRMKKPGDEIEVTYIRKSKERTARVKLASHRIPPVADQGSAWRFKGVPGLPEWRPAPNAPYHQHSWKDHWDELEKHWGDGFNEWWGEHGHEWRDQFEDWGNRWREEWEKQLDDPEGVRKQLREMLEEARSAPGVDAHTFRFLQQQVTVKDEDGTLEITMKDGKKHVTATDPDGMVVFEGFCETDEERAKMPDDILRKVDGIDIDVQLDWPNWGAEPAPKEKAKPRKKPAPGKKNDAV